MKDTGGRENGFGILYRALPHQPVRGAAAAARVALVLAYIIASQPGGAVNFTLYRARPSPLSAFSWRIRCMPFVILDIYKNIANRAAHTRFTTAVVCEK